MAGNNEQFEPHDSSDFSDDVIRRFLLGGLSASEQPAFERRLLIDHALAARVRLAEFELSDDYADESLSSRERELLEAAFLLSADRRRKVRVSRALRDHFAPAPVSNVASPAVTYLERLRSVLSFGRPAWRFAFAAVIFILLFGTVWVAVKKEGRLKEAIAKQIRRRRAPNPTAPVESNHPTNNSTPDHQPGSSPMPDHEPAPAPVIEVISLAPEGSPGGSNLPSVSLPEGVQDIVRLQLALNPNQAGTYGAELLTAEGQSVFSAESIKVEGKDGAPIDFDVPARLLRTGNYQIRLNRDQAGARENVGSYNFRVQWSQAGGYWRRLRSNRTADRTLPGMCSLQNRER